MASSSSPSKSDIEAILHRLRAIPTNKTCFDCGAKNPTWATVTYGVFICIDCSAVHRSLGVHLSFVRSTNLDTNWSWIQLRQMQVGGNASASQFFRQHNCNTEDAQQKYNSRAAQLYRDKLSNSAQQAMKLHGTKIHIESQHDESKEVEAKEVDFFADCSNEESNTGAFNNLEEDVPSVKPQKIAVDEVSKLSDTGAPSVDFLNSAVPVEAPKSTIGVRKIQPKKAGLGAKKGGGLGATKVKANFAEIEQKASMADQIKVELPDKKLTMEEEQEAMTSVRLAYQDLSLKKTKEEERLKNIDPTKAKQMERLGMGFNKKNVVSHSALSDMQTITQENAPKLSSSSKGSSSMMGKDKDEPYDYFRMMDYYLSQQSSNSDKFEDAKSMGFDTLEPIDDQQPKVQSMFADTPKKSSYESDNKYNSKPSSTTTTTSYKTYENDEAQKKFANAKAISSEQFFGNNQSSEEASNNLARFQGSNSISSADYFGDPASSSNHRHPHSSRIELAYNGPDLDEVKESVRQGVHKVAQKLGNLANDWMR